MKKGYFKDMNKINKGYHKRKQVILSIILYFIGVFFMPAGIVLTINSNAGAGGYDALNFAIGDILKIKTSYAIYITAVISILIAALIRKSIPRITTFISSFLIGVFTDFWKSALINIQAVQYIESVIILAAGMLIIAVAAAAYMLSSFPTNPTDDLVVALKERGLSIKTAKISFDFVCAVLAFCIGGNISWGTIVITFGTGPLVDMFYQIINKRIGCV